MEKLVRQAQRGSKDAFVELVERNKQSMVRAASAILRDDEDVADAVAETVLCMIQKLGELRQPRYFKTWMTRILINNCCRILRGKKREVAVADIPERSYEERHEQDMDVQASLEKLSHNDRLILTLYYMDDLTSKSIAELLGEKESTIKARILRGKKRFIRLYTQREEAYEQL